MAAGEIWVTSADNNLHYRNASNVEYQVPNRRNGLNFSLNGVSTVPSSAGEGHLVLGHFGEYNSGGIFPAYSQIYIAWYVNGFWRYGAANDAGTPMERPNGRLYISNSVLFIQINGQGEQLEWV